MRPPSDPALAALAVLVASACCRVGAGSVGARELEDERRAQVSRAGAGFDSVVVPPFVVVANGPRDVRDDAERTIVWARDRLRADFFDKEPGKPLTIWVFPDEESYMSGTSAVLGTIPDTPYGFYRPCRRALVVNAGYGWGTLVHEMVHAYMDADFPDAPVWMQEGLASLFEATEDEGGHIRGKTNWRLPALQEAIGTGRAPSFHALAHGSRGDFDGKTGHLYYAGARYLLYWLQEEGRLRPFYRAYRARSGRDPRGLGVLREVCGRDLAEVRVDWERFVSSLTVRR